ncbi:MAG: type II secretion system GspH family protein [Candidatus Hydrogenedentes bacterium]|nr:type II secretion system GspH family protein [Candidatus Hydrogenedentota bacterium]
MKHASYCGRRGFTLVELMVVLAIVILLSALAIPGLARLGAFSRDEIRRTVQEVSSVLRAAQVYSTTYHVNTAVVYSMDHWSDTEAAALDATPGIEDPLDPADPIVDPVFDSVSGNAVRQIEAAAIMYQLPSTMGALSGRYVPIPGDAGGFQELPQDMSILLMDPENPTAPASGVPADFYFNVVRSNYHSDGALAYNLPASLGMSRVPVALQIPVGLDVADLLLYANGTTPFVEENFAAHLFKPSGRLSAPAARERVTIYVGPTADRPPEDRLVDVIAGQLINVDDTPNMNYRKIHIFKSTGRIEIPKNF